ncbi:MAG: diacylglycerol kinase family protein [Mobilicoccus sp.]|nr:diacylglycerol kinase family protein [Mobilicoccus sp.]
MTAAQASTDSRSRRRVAAVVKAVLPEALEALDQLRETCEVLDLDGPQVYETSIESPGREQARQAVEDGADVVVAIGGDGTVTQVASGLVGTGVPLGIMPAGTANLYALNAGLTGLSLRHTSRTAVAGAPQKADIGHATLATTHGEVESHFLVVVGIGHDAQTLSEVPEHGKRNVGAMSYILPGLKRLQSEQHTFRQAVNDEEMRDVTAWSLLVMNTGRLPYGMTLVPDARPNGEAITLAILEPRGLHQWAHVGLTRFRPRYTPPSGLRTRRGERIRIETDEPLPAQIDGELIENVTAIDASVEPGALIVHTLPTGRAVPKMDDLTDEAVAKLIYDSHGEGMSPGGQQAVAAMLCSLEGERFEHVKYLLNSSGDAHDLERLVYDDLSEGPRMKVLEHIAKQAKVVGQVEDIRILCDIDDTVKCAIHDDRYPKGTVYPGIEQFLTELDGGTAEQPGRAGDVTFVTARPGGPAGLLERYTRDKMDDLDLPPHTIMGGSLLNLHTKTAIASRKNENIARDRDLFPECRMVFLGDSGQADAHVGLRARRYFGEHVVAVFIHDVIGIDEETRTDWAREGVYAVDTWDEAARKAGELGLIKDEAVKRVEQAVEEGIQPKPRQS